MEFVYWILCGAGCFVAAAGSISLFATAVTLFYDWRHEPHYRSFYQGKQEALQRLKQDSYWFSESPEAMRLLADLAEGKDVSSARVTWRESRKESEAKPWVKPCQNTARVANAFRRSKSFVARWRASGVVRSVIISTTLNSTTTITITSRSALATTAGRIYILTMTTFIATNAYGMFSNSGGSDER